MTPDLRRVVFVHTVLIEKYGGSRGVRDLESLEAAIARPWGASFGREHFPSAFDKAAAICESVIRRHPFVDGNKRTGVTMGAYLLSTLGNELTATNEELEDLAVAVATGEVSFEGLSRWFEEHSRRA